MHKKIWSLLMNCCGGKTNQKRKITKGLLRGFYYHGTYKDKHYFNNFEKDIAYFFSLKTAISNAKVIYDVGGHFGSYALLFSRLTKRNSKIYSFEPNKFAFEKLVKNILLNNLKDRVVPVNIALGSEKGSGVLSVLTTNFARSTLNGELKKQYINREQLDLTVNIEMADDLDLPRPDLVKIDVEGFEVDVLLGMSNILTLNSPDIVVEIHGIEKEGKLKTLKKVLEILDKHAYYYMNIESKKQLLSVDLSVRSPVNGHIYASINKERILESIQ